MRYRTLLLDFDGTLTAPDRITDAFLHAYRAAFLARVGEAHAGLWDRTLDAVRHASPHMAWMLEGYEACPVAADPYILASAVADRVLVSIDRRDLAALPNELYAQLYVQHAAPFRPEAAEVLEGLRATGATVAIVSNASTGKIEGRLAELGVSGIPVVGNARKFGVRPATVASPHRARFDALPDVVPGMGLGRPVWLRRGAFFDAMASIWGQDADGPARTLFCGDIFELDLVLPSALGCDVHLVERAAPLATHDAERASVAATPGAAFSADLRGLLARVQAG
jgi:FMN phosphatase YigB (HAD superfamily)